MMATPKREVRVTTQPESVVWPEMHYVFIEKHGPFMETAPAAWGAMHGSLIPKIKEHNVVEKYLSLYKIGPSIYRAGVALAEEPQNLPEGVSYEKFAGGKYSKFVMTGPFSDLPEACGRVFRAVEEQKLKTRDDFNIEHYVSDPRTTPENENVIDILVPTE
jgi:predicted transcriptional regulator YdeE